MIVRATFVGGPADGTDHEIEERLLDGFRYPIPRPLFESASADVKVAHYRCPFKDGSYAVDSAGRYVMLHREDA